MKKVDYCRCYVEEASGLLETCQNSFEAQGFQCCHHQVSAVWLRYYLAAERRLEETGCCPSPMVAPDYAHPLCILQQNHWWDSAREVPASQVVITTATSTSAPQPYTATGEQWPPPDGHFWWQTQPTKSTRELKKERLPTLILGKRGWSFRKGQSPTPSMGSKTEKICTRSCTRP